MENSDMNVVWTWPLYSCRCVLGVHQHIPLLTLHSDNVISEGRKYHPTYLYLYISYQFKVYRCIFHILTSYLDSDDFSESFLFSFLQVC